jgi:hypothetical protein
MTTEPLVTLNQTARLSHAKSKSVFGAYVTPRRHLGMRQPTASRQSYGVTKKDHI